MESFCRVLILKYNLISFIVSKIILLLMMIFMTLQYIIYFVIYLLLIIHLFDDYFTTLFVISCCIFITSFVLWKGIAMINGTQLIAGLGAEGNSYHICFWSQVNFTSICNSMGNTDQIPMSYIILPNAMTLKSFSFTLF